MQYEILREMAECHLPWPPGQLTPMRVREVLSKLTLDGWIPITWVVDGRQSDPRRGISVRIEVYINHRDTGELVKVYHPKTLRPCRDESHLLHQARQLLIQVVTHELDEFLLLDGERLNDPHESDVQCV